MRKFSKNIPQNILIIQKNQINFIYIIHKNDYFGLIGMKILNPKHFAAYLTILCILILTDVRACQLVGALCKNIKKLHWTTTMWQHPAHTAGHFMHLTNCKTLQPTDAQSKSETSTTVTQYSSNQGISVSSAGR